MKKEQIINELITSADGNGLIHTLHGFFGSNVKVSIPLGQRTLDSSIDEVDFSVRSSNCLKRTGMMRIRDVVESLEEGRLQQIRNLGKISYNEIQTKLLVLAYNNLSNAEKKKFFFDLLERNEYVR